MASLNGLKKDLTILLIAHRLSTLKNCDLIIEISNGEISRTGSYEDICLSLLQ
jgi:ATP-binding cassette subfamily B protein